MSLFGDFPETVIDKLLRFILHFVLGAIMGLFPALLVWVVTEGWKGPVLAIVITGLFLGLLSLYRRGELVTNLMEFLGQEADD